MPKAKDDQAPNFVASNKYSMLPDDVDPDNVEE
jgi:translation initiation factor 4B